MAVCSAEACRAFALVRSRYHRYASRTIEARRTATDIDFTITSHVPVRTFARIMGNGTFAFAIILAGRGSTLVDLGRAGRVLPAVFTSAHLCQSRRERRKREWRERENTRKGKRNLCVLEVTPALECLSRAKAGPMCARVACTHVSFACPANKTIVATTWAARISTESETCCL